MDYPTPHDRAARRDSTSRRPTGQLRRRVSRACRPLLSSIERRITALFEFITADRRSPRFFQVIMIDLVLAGDNAIVIGLAAAGLPAASAHQGHPDRHRRGDRAAHRVRRLSPRSCCRSSACCSPAASCCSGCAGRCGASCAPRMRTRSTPRKRVGDTTSMPTARSPRRRAAQDLRAGRLADRRSPTSRCRSTTCWRSPAPRAIIPMS